MSLGKSIVEFKPENNNVTFRELDFPCDFKKEHSDGEEWYFSHCNKKLEIYDNNTLITLEGALSLVKGKLEKPNLNVRYSSVVFTSKVHKKESYSNGFYNTSSAWERKYRNLLKRKNRTKMYLTN